MLTNICLQHYMYRFRDCLTVLFRLCALVPWYLGAIEVFVLLLLLCYMASHINI